MLIKQLFLTLFSNIAFLNIFFYRIINTNKLNKSKIPQTIATKYHILFWLGYFAFNFFRWGSYFNDYWYSLKSNLVEFPIHIAVVYINVYYLIPKFILRKKYWQYIAALLTMLGLVYIFRTGLNYLLVTEEIWPEADRQGRFLEFNHVVAVILGELYVIAFVTAIKLTVDWLLERKRNEELAKLQLSTELKFLKTQIQPHFFFNTLNNLYALTLKKSDNAPQLVVKLSDMMQYVLYEVNESKVDLLQEINHINNYIDIERLRFYDKVEATLNITGNIEDVQVPPLLFLPFIENCFKHGLTENDVVEINVDFAVENNNLLFNLTNTFNPDTQNTYKEKSGIGLANAQRRLNLLYFNNFKLETNINQNKYHLYLKIPV